MKVKGKLLFLTAVLAVLIAAPVQTYAAPAVQAAPAAAQKAAAKKKVADWTVMVYLNGNSNLAFDNLRIVNQMEETGSTDNVQMVVHMTRRTDQLRPSAPYQQTKSGLIVPSHKLLTPDEVNGGTVRYHVLKDESKKVVSSLPLYAEGDPGEYTTLLNFIKWSKQAYPAKHYMLMLYGHGAGFMGTGYSDAAGGGAGMKLNELELALKAGGGVDIFFLYSCLMQMAEVSQSLDGAAKLVMGSETSMLTGVPFNEMFATISANADKSVPVLAAALTDSVMKYDTRLGRSDPAFTFSLVRPEGLKNVVAALDKYADAVMSEHDLESALFARDNALRVDPDKSSLYNDFCDLGYFVRVQASKSKSERVRSAAKELLTVMYGDYIVKVGQDNTPMSRATSGVSIYLPSKKHKMLQAYFETPFGKSKWGNFIRWMNMVRE